MADWLSIADRTLFGLQPFAHGNVFVHLLRLRVLGCERAITLEWSVVGCEYAITLGMVSCWTLWTRLTPTVGDVSPPP